MGADNEIIFALHTDAMAVVQPVWSNVGLNSEGLDWMEEMKISTGELRLAAIKLPKCESSLHFQQCMNLIFL